MNHRIEYLKELYDKSQEITKNDHGKAETLRTSSYSVLSSLFGENSIYVRQLEPIMKGYAGAFIHDIRAILQSAVTDLEKGALTSYEQTLLLGTFENFLIQARELNKGGDNGKKPAGVLVSGVFEDFLSRLCRFHELEPPRKAQGKIDLLKSEQVINAIQASQLETLRELRNSAFHAEWDDYTNKNVGDSIEELEDLISHLLS